MLTDVRLWTTEEYHRMIAAGIFDASERVELLRGQIVRMAAKGILHRATLKHTERLLEELLGDLVLVYTQDPIELDNRSEPEPDIAVVIPPLERYDDHHPSPSEIYLVIEIADTSLKKDCEEKALSYAQAGIADYWVLDVNERQLHLFREPHQTGFQSYALLGEEASLAPLAFPNTMLIVSAMFPRLR